LQIDLLENPAIDDVVMLSIVLEEVKNKNMSVYNRVRALCSNSLRRFFVFANEHHKYAPLLYHVIIFLIYFNASTDMW
jgi:exosome complex exonuclease DIS3/RRP44